MEAALVGDYRPEHLFVLDQIFKPICFYQVRLQESDREIETVCSKWPSISRGVLPSGQVIISAPCRWSLAFRSMLVRRLVTHHTAVVTTRIKPADIIAHDDKDVCSGFFRLTARCLRCARHFRLLQPHQQPGLRHVRAEVNKATGDVLGEVLQARFNHRIMEPIFQATR
jgi:hypothetical protein